MGKARLLTVEDDFDISKFTMPSHGWSALIGNLHKDERWASMEELPAENRSVIVAPLMVGAEILGIIMPFHRESNAFYYY